MKENKPVSHTLLIALIATGFIVRLIIVVSSDGSNDIRTWQHFAASIDNYGLLGTYGKEPLFNHPPLMGWWSVLALYLEQVTGVRFSIWFKVPSIIADILATVIIWRIWRPAGAVKALVAAALFSLNPVSILISSFHGNTDALLAVLSLYSAYLLAQGAFLGGGLVLGAAINVKLIPILLIPGFLLQLFKRPGFFRFTSGLAVGIIPFIPVVFFIGETFYANAIAYQSNLEMWGINYILISLAKINMPWAVELIGYYYQSGRHLVFFLVIMFAFVARMNRRWHNYYQLGAVTYAIFLVFTPGFGIQYLVWITPLLFACSLPIAFLYNALGGLFALLTYYFFLGDFWPLSSVHTSPIKEPAVLVGLFAWLSLIFYLGKVLADSGPDELVWDRDSKPGMPSVKGRRRSGQYHENISGSVHEKDFLDF